MNFAEYVAGRNIAVVGPAPLLTNQSSDIDGHDIVYRVAQHASVGGWYGQRVDVVYLNGAFGRTILNDEQRHLRAGIDDAAWWVYKQRDGRQYRPDGLQRVAHPPSLTSNPNAVTGILWDLTHFEPASITVFGADLYAGGPDGAYYQGYDRHAVTRQASAFLAHKPLQQLHAHRAINATGLIRGDDRYLAAAAMTDAQYEAVIDSWQQALEPLT